MIPRFTEAAARDLEDIRSHIGTHAGIDIAEQVVSRIGITITAVCRFPHIGHAGHVRDTLEMRVPRLPFVVIYRIETSKGEIIVLRVYHTSRNRRM